jgi:archaeosine synthase beta-subunit
MCCGETAEEKETDMNELTCFCQSFKKDFIPRKQDPRQPVRCWSEKDALNSKIVDAYVIILRTRGCSWALSSGCTMCGYFNDSMLAPVSENDLMVQFEKAMETYKGEKIVKIFTSGSFLDPQEIPVAVQQRVLTVLFERSEKVSVESRPEYVTEKRVQHIQKVIQPKTFEIGIGLETSNDLVREKAINKGFTFLQYKKAAQLLKHHQMSVKTYVLLKPPFLTEKDALNDSIRTAHVAAPFSDVISLNPTNIQRHTVVEYLWKRNQYRPPWLWSIIEFLKQSKDLFDVHVKCDTVAGGSQRGAHNCGSCDRTILTAIEQFSLTQKQHVLKDFTCACKEKWLDQLDLEKLSFGSFPDFGRWNP